VPTCLGYGFVVYVSSADRNSRTNGEWLGSWHSVAGSSKFFFRSSPSHSKRSFITPETHGPRKVCVNLQGPRNASLIGGAATDGATFPY